MQRALPIIYSAWPHWPRVRLPMLGNPKNLLQYDMNIEVDVFVSYATTRKVNTIVEYVYLTVNGQKTLAPANGESIERRRLYSYSMFVHIRDFILMFI